MTLIGEVPQATIEPDYRPIEREAEARLLEQALAANPEVSESAATYGLLTIEGDSPYSNVARALECQIFDKYFGNDPEEMRQEYAPYEKSSKFFLLIDRENLKPAGVMRIVAPGEAGFKSVNDLPTDKSRTVETDEPITALDSEQIQGVFGIDPSRTLDVATIAAAPEYGEKQTGSPIVLASLMRAVYKYSLANGYDDLVAIIDAVPLEKLKSVNLPIHTSPYVASPFKYLGAEGNTFIHIPIPAVEASVSAKDKVIFDYIFGEAELFGETKLSFDRQ